MLLFFSDSINLLIDRRNVQRYSKVQRNILRIIVSLLFMFITIVSVLRPIDSFCLSKIHTSEVKSDLIKASYDMTHKGSEAASADHLACDVCHIGHCSFMISSSFVATNYGQIKLFGFVKAKIQSSDFSQNLFRPPIV